MTIKISEEFIKKFGKKFPPESVLFREGEMGASMFIISSGRVGIIKSTPMGDKTLAVLKEGAFFGEMALMGTQPKRAATARCVEETIVLELNREAFESFIKRSPEMAISIMTVLCERLRDSNAKTSALIHKDDYMRVSTYIRSLSEDRGKPSRKDGPGRIFPVQLESVAGAVGVTVDIVLKYLTAARKARVIGQNGEWLYVPQPGYLVPFAEFISKK